MAYPKTDEDVIAVFYARRENNVHDHELVWASRHVSRILIIPSYTGADGHISVRFDEAPEISDQALDSDDPHIDVWMSAAVTPQLFPKVIFVEKQISSVTWMAPVANTHHAFQLIVIGPKRNPQHHAADFAGKFEG